MAFFSPANINTDIDFGPKLSGPPIVNVFGGGIDPNLSINTGTSRSASLQSPAIVNAIISPVSSSVIGFDILDPGNGYTEAPFVSIEDQSGKGSGAYAVANMTNDDNGFLKIKNISVISGGDGYLNTTDGSLCGNGFVWKEPDEGYVVRSTGEYQVVQINRPINLNPGDIYYPPNGPSKLIKTPETIILGLEPITIPQANVVGNPYQVVLSIEGISVLDSGFGYRPGDKILVTPDRGAILEPVINRQGQITEVKVINGGVGFDDIPEIKTNSLSGFNAQLMPIFKVTRLNENNALNIPKDAKIVTVIDCVGKF